MEVRRLAIFIMFLELAAMSQCSAHAMHRRQAEDEVNFEDPQADEGFDEFGGEETQNDTGDSPAAQRVEPASISTLPTTYKIEAGKSARLECNVQPDSAVVQWWRNDELYFMGNAKLKYGLTKISIVPNSKDLLIKDVSATDAGVYRCEIVQDTPVSINHTLEVLQAPVIENLTATNGGYVVEGSNLLLTCNVHATPAPQIMWSREVANVNERLRENDGEFTGNSLYIKNVKREESGKYYCYVLNALGHTQAEIDVHVVGKPRVHVHKTRVNSAINIEAVLQCTAHEEPDLHMRWYKDGKLIEDISTQYTVSTNGHHSNLTATPLTSLDFGTFTCEAENLHGKHNRSIELVQSPVIEDVSADGPKVSWTVQSHQPLEELELQLKPLNAAGSSWIRYNVPLPKPNGHRYEIVHRIENDVKAGKYEVMVKARNTHSWGSAPEPVTVDVEESSIRSASVFGGNLSNGNSNRFTSSILSSFVMYLLVRMF
ncbi:limbic system-associated membrane protein [Bombyx mori]|uniref:Uncharacterized protein n=1 Tax=Bombyx mori TaxID=7091 RepID=A0A8R2C4T9_BOMMO|nr:limbic system-associated membrane protein [Bombyx mori]